MERRRSSAPSRPYRLLLRVYGAENLKHVSSQGTYCKITLEEGALTRGSARASLKRLLQKSDPASEFRVYKTQAQKSICGKPVWNEKFEIPIFDPAHQTLNIRVKSARLMSAPAIGEVTLLLRDVSTDATWDRWINLLDNSKRPVGRLRIQMRLDSMSPLSRSVDEDELRDQYVPRRTSTHSSRSMPSPVPRAARRGAVIAPPIAGAGLARRSSTLSRSLLDSHASGSVSAGESISSDNSNDRNSIPVAPTSYSENSYSSENPFQDSIMSSPLISRSSKSSSFPRDTGMGSNARFTGLSASERDTGSNARFTGLSASERDTGSDARFTGMSASERDTGSNARFSRMSASELDSGMGSNARFTGMSGSDRYTGLSRPTGTSYASRATEELDFLASKYMVRSTQASARQQPVPEDDESESENVLPVQAPPERGHPTSNRALSQCELETPIESLSPLSPLSPLVPASTSVTQLGSSVSSASQSSSPPSSSTSPASPRTSGPTPPSKATGNKANSQTGTSSESKAKDERSPRTTNTTATSSDDENPIETVEFDFDTGVVRPSTRLPSQIKRRTSSRSYRSPSQAEPEYDQSDDESEEREDDELDPDGDSDGPRMVLRPTVMKVLGRDSVNVIMDADEEDEDYDDFESDPFLFDEFPILGMNGTLLMVDDMDYANYS